MMQQSLLVQTFRRTQCLIKPLLPKLLYPKALPKLWISSLSQSSGRSFSSVDRSPNLLLELNYKHNRNTWDLIKNQLHESDNNKTVVVFDDDPTGCQSLYDINVLLDYSKQSLMKQLLLNHKLFYVLINSRSMTSNEARSVNQKALTNLAEAMEEIDYSKKISLISRSDSTLRGHFPLETDSMIEFANNNNKSISSCFPAVNGVVICPTFFEGGRYTINDIHYLKMGDKFIPVGESDFAKDAHFGYKSSNLVDWIVEKSQGKIRKESIITISLDEIRQKSEEYIQQKLLSRKGKFTYIVVNSK
jgi:uncharacterized protein YgbK (DUF1537 family)